MKVMNSTQNITRFTPKHNGPSQNTDQAGKTGVVQLDLIWRRRSGLNIWLKLLNLPEAERGREIIPQQVLIASGILDGNSQMPRAKAIKILPTGRMCAQLYSSR